MSAIRRDQARSRIKRLVKSCPGLNKTQLSRRLGLAWDTLSHHFKVLARKGQVQVRRHGRFACIYPAEHDLDGIALLAPLRDIGGFIAEKLHARPGARLHELADGLGVSRKVVRRHLDALDQEGVIQAEGRLNRGYRIDYHWHRPGHILPRSMGSEAREVQGPERHFLAAHVHANRRCSQRAKYRLSLAGFVLRAGVVLASSLLLTVPATASDGGLDAPVLTGYTAQAVYLEWSPVGGATGYEVHRDGIHIASTGEHELSYVDPDPTAPDDAEYMVRATAGDQVGPFSTIFPRDQEPCLYIYKPPTISIGITPRNCIALARAILDNVTIHQG